MIKKPDSTKNKSTPTQPIFGDSQDFAHEIELATHAAPHVVDQHQQYCGTSNAVQRTDVTVTRGVGDRWSRWRMRCHAANRD